MTGTLRICVIWERIATACLLVIRIACGHLSRAYCKDFSPSYIGSIVNIGSVRQ
jgi:hypothetical protein